MSMPNIDEIHVSATFSWDLPEAERLADLWSAIAPTRLGGPATGMRGEDFTPGMYLREGDVITSRGCPNHCWFCVVPKRDGPLRELPIHEGWNLRDDNILACSEQHIRAVFAMLARQRGHKVCLSGGIEAAALQYWHAQLIASVHPDRCYLAYDSPADYAPLVEAVALLRRAEMEQGRPRIVWLRCYVLIGGPNDTPEKAQQRMDAVADLGVLPYPMLYRDPASPDKARPEYQCVLRAWGGFQGRSAMMACEAAHRIIDRMKAASR